MWLMHIDLATVWLLTLRQAVHVILLEEGTVSPGVWGYRRYCAWLETVVPANSTCKYGLEVPVGASAPEVARSNCEHKLSGCSIQLPRRRL
jgi:hypothetical protein